MSSWSTKLLTNLTPTEPLISDDIVIARGHPGYVLVHSSPVLFFPNRWTYMIIGTAVVNVCASKHWRSDHSSVIATLFLCIFPREHGCSSKGVVLLLCSNMAGNISAVRCSHQIPNGYYIPGQSRRRVFVDGGWPFFLYVFFLNPSADW